MGLYLEKLVVMGCIIAAAIIIIICCCFIYEHFVSRQRLEWGCPWASEEEEKIEIPDIGGHTGVNRGGLNREPVGDNNSPSRDAQYPRKQWDGRAWLSSRGAESSQEQYNMTRNVIIEELGRSGRKGGEYRGKSTGDHNLPSRDAQYPGKQWDGRSFVKSRDPQSSQKQYINTRNVREERLKAPVTSAPAVLELEKPTSSHGGYRGGFTRKPTGDNNDSDPKEKKTKNQGELSQQEKREERLRVPVPSAPAVLELEKPRSSLGDSRGDFTGQTTGGNNDSDLKKKKTKNLEELSQQERREVNSKAPVPSAPALLEPKKPRSLQGGQTCCVCMTQTIEIIFNCAHASTCEECAKSLCVCPICRADITSKNRIYLIGV